MLCLQHYLQVLSSKEQCVISPSPVKVQEVLTICWILGGLYFKLSFVEYHLAMFSVARRVLVFPPPSPICIFLSPLLLSFICFEI